MGMSEPVTPTEAEAEQITKEKLMEERTMPRAAGP